MAETTIEVRAWGRLVGAVAADPKGGAYAFEYAKSWLRSGIELAPLTMPVAGARAPFLFPALNHETFKGLPGLLADSLPDKFGTNLIDAWLARRGQPKPGTTTLDYLAYMGRRGMGALEFRPARGSIKDAKAALDLGALVDTARSALRGDLAGDGRAQVALANIIRVGTSAGGARAKAVVAWNPVTQEIRAGQFDVPDGFEHWLLKFDGVGEDKGLGDGRGYGMIEYAYSLMAKAAGIDMMPCRLLAENGRHHFMTKRWDRDGHAKLHAQSLCGMAHLDFNQRATHACEQLFQVAEQIGLGEPAKEQLFRRVVLNVAAANCDDHTKNHAFVLPEGGRWQLAPAYDLSHACNPHGGWTNQHQMSVHGKFNGVARADMMALADVCGVPGAARLIDDVMRAVRQWPDFAVAAGVSQGTIKRIAADFQPL